MEKNIETERKKLVNEDIELVYEEATVNGNVVRYVPTSRHSFKRIKTLVSKEPTTLPWIDTFKRDEVYVDVGANVGMYAIYAGVCGARVYAFEPESQNYAELNKNIFINNLFGRVTAYCMAMSDVAEISLLYLSTFSIGFSHHDFGENRWKDDLKFNNRSLPKEQRPVQGCFSFTLDELVERGVIPPPNHLKIDVDGFENKVVKGAEKTLRSDSLKTILIELDFKIPEHAAILDYLVGMGWHFSEDQVRTNTPDLAPYHVIESRMKQSKGMANFIFYKDKKFYDDFFADFLKTYVPPVQ